MLRFLRSLASYPPRAITAPMVGVLSAFAAMAAFSNAAQAFVVTNGNDSGPGSLRQVLGTTVGGPITFDPSVTTVTLTSGELGVVGGRVIEGRGMGGVTIQRADNASDFRIFNLNFAPNVTLRGLTIRNGRGAGHGGGIFSLGSGLTLEDCVLADNQTTGSGDQGGGGLYASAVTPGFPVEIAVTRSLIIDNVSGQGGGILSVADQGVINLTVTDTTFDGNSSSIWGGAIMNLATNNSLAKLVVTGSTISNHFATGAAVMSYAGSGSNTARASFTNTTASGNTGGGFVVRGDPGASVSQTLHHVTMRHSSTETIAASMASATTTYDRSIFAFLDDTSPFVVSAGDGGTANVISLGYNVSKRDLPGATATDLAFADPLLDPAGLSDHGGPTYSVLLQPGSPARDRIPGTDCTQAADQRGVARPYPAGGNCDSGAIEMVPLAQSILVGTPAPASAIFGNSFLIGATSSSGLPVTITTAGGCSIAGSSVTMTSGTTACVVHFNQSGDAYYSPAPEVLAIVTAQKQAQAIAFGPLSDRRLNQSPLVVAATASTGLAVTFSTTTPARCTAGGANGATITLVSTGTCTVKADQAGNADYVAAPSVLQSFTVGNKADQTITVKAAPPAAAAYGASFAVSATASSGLAVSIAATGGCSNAGGIVTMTSGTTACVVHFNQTGSNSFNAAPEVLRNVTAQLAVQAITVTQPAPASAAFKSTFAVAATASSGLPVAISASGGCAIAGDTVTMNSSSVSCAVQFNQAANTNYAPAPAQYEVVTATKAGQAISFATLADRKLKMTPFTVSASATSGLPVTFTTSTPATCTGSGTNGATISLLAMGTCSVSADQAGDADTNAAAPVTRSFAIK